MKTKAVEVGTRKEGRIMAIASSKPTGDVYAPRFVAIAGRDGEGYLLFNPERFQFVPQCGAEVEYIACKGGPTGIYWRVTKEVIFTHKRWEDVTSEVLDGDIEPERKRYLLALLKEHCRTNLINAEDAQLTRRRFLDNVSRQT